MTYLDSMKTQIVRIGRDSYSRVETLTEDGDLFQVEYFRYMEKDRKTWAKTLWNGLLGLFGTAFGNAGA